MSSLTFHQLWVKANRETDILVDWEALARPEADQSKFQQLALLYIKCNQIFRKLQLAVDYLTHPQKRRISRDLCVTILARMLEIRQELTKIKIKSPRFFLDILRDLKITPQELETVIPVELLDSLHLYRKQINEYFSSIEASVPTIEKIAVNQAEIDIPFADAIRIIQLNERGRQGKVRAEFMADINKRSANATNNSNKKSVNLEHSSAVIEKYATNIQRIYRGYRARKLRKQMLKDDLEFLGIAELDFVDENSELLKKEEILGRRRVFQEQHEKDYQAALVSKEKLGQVEGPLIKDNMIEQFRGWYLETKKTTGQLPELPPEDDWKLPTFDFQSFISPNRATSNDSANGGAGKADAKKGAAAPTEEQPIAWQILRIKRALEIYQKDWAKLDETNNFEQTFEPDMIRAIKRKEVELEVKDAIYEVLREELSSVKASLEKESGKGKGKKKDKGAGGKKGKKGANDKNKIVEIGEYLPVTEELKVQLGQIVATGVLQKPLPKTFDEITGEMNAIWDGCGYTHSPGDIKQLVRESLIFPFLCEPELVQNVKIPCSILICGPRGTGKFSLINAAVQTTKATLINISAASLAKATTPEQSAGALVASLFKLAKAIAPSVVYMDDAESVFAKKAKEGVPFDTRSIKKDLAKSLKSLRPADRVLFVGRSDQPWDADIKTLMPSFERVIYVPKPDYATRYNLWRDKLKKCGKSYENVNTSMLASASEGLTAIQIIDAFHSVISKRNRNNQQTPLKTIEFLSSLPVVDSAQEALQKEWVMKAFGII